MELVSWKMGEHERLLQLAKQERQQPWSEQSGRRQGGGESISRVWSDTIGRIRVGSRRVAKCPVSVMSGRRGY